MISVYLLLDYTFSIVLYFVFISLRILMNNPG